MQLVTLVGAPGAGKSRLVLEVEAASRADADPPGLVEGARAPVRRRGRLLGARRERESPSRHPRRRRRRARTAEAGAAPRRAAGRPRRAALGRAVRPAARRRRHERPPRRGSAARHVRGVAAPRRGCRRRASARARARGRALGRRRPARLRRVPRRVGGAGAAARSLHGAAGAVRAAAGLGRGKAEHAGRSRSRRSPTTRRLRCCGALLGREPPAGDARGAARTRRRQPVVRRAVRPDADRARRRRAELPLPDSVQGIIAARLDRLPAEEKLLLQDAAVAGRGFSTEVVAAIGGGSVEDAVPVLHRLERKDLVRRAAAAGRGADVEYAFAHRPGPRRRVRRDRARGARGEASAGRGMARGARASGRHGRARGAPLPRGADVPARRTRTTSELDERTRQALGVRATGPSPSTRSARPRATTPARSSSGRPASRAARACCSGSGKRNPCRKAEARTCSSRLATPCWPQATPTAPPRRKRCCRRSTGTAAIAPARRSTSTEPSSSSAARRPRARRHGCSHGCLDG